MRLVCVSMYIALLPRAVTMLCCAVLCCAVLCHAVLQEKASVSAAEVPQLLLLPPQEVSARLEALAASMKVRGGVKGGEGQGGTGRWKAGEGEGEGRGVGWGGQKGGGGQEGRGGKGEGKGGRDMEGDGEEWGREGRTGESWRIWGEHRGGGRWRGEGSLSEMALWCLKHPDNALLSYLPPLSTWHSSNVGVLCSLLSGHRL